MIQIQSFDERMFLVDGITHYRKFFSNVRAGNLVRIYNAFNPVDVLVDYVKFDQIELNGVIYPTVEQLQTALLEVIFTADFGDGSGSFNQNNIPVAIPFNYSGEPTEQNLALAVNSLPPFIVSDKQIAFFLATNPDQPIEQSKKVTFVLKNVGKGNYGQGGTVLTSDNILILAVGVPNIYDILPNPRTQIIDLGTITGDVSEAVNALNPPVQVQGQADGYVVFKATIDVNDSDYLFLSEGGIYGEGATQTTIEDFLLLQGGAISPPDFIPNLQQVLTTGNESTGTIILKKDLSENIVNLGADEVLVFNGENYTKLTFQGLEVKDINNNVFKASPQILTFLNQSGGACYLIPPSFNENQYNYFLPQKSGTFVFFDDLTGKEDKYLKNNANGYAGLDANGKIFSSQVPSIAISDTFVVASQSAMLALVAQVGDIAVRTDLSKSFILKGSDPAGLSNWQELLTPMSPVQSVFGRTGVVTAGSGDYTTNLVTESANKNYQTDNQKLFNDATGSIQTQINNRALKSDISGTINYLPKFTGAGSIGNSQVFDNGTNVGIGTPSPQANVHSYSELNTENIIDSPYGSSILTMTSAIAGASFIGFSSKFVLGKVTGFGTSGFSEFLRIASNGNVGMGMTNPTFKLDVKGSDSNGIRYTGSSGVQSVLGCSSVTAQIGSLSAHDVDFLVGASLSAKFRTNGNVLIGTSPDDGVNRLQVDGGLKSTTSEASYSKDITGADLNLLSLTGFFRGSGITNAPSDGWFFIISENHNDGSWRKQTATSFGGGANSIPAGYTYVRVLSDGAWTSWKKLTDANDAGIYVPTISNLTNITAVAVPKGRYSKVGKIVTLQIDCQVQTTAVGITVFNFSLPFPIKASSAPNGNGSASGNVASDFTSAFVRSDQVTFRANIANYYQVAFTLVYETN